MRRMYSQKEIEQLALTKAQELIESGAIENAKPIYWHGINMFGGGEGTPNSIQFHILNNTNTKINSIDKVKAWAQSISGAVVISCNGAIQIEGVGYVVHAITKSAGNAYNIYYVGATGSQFISNVNISDYFNQVEDATNKIN